MNLETIVSSGSKGEGIAKFANVPFDIDPSLRPSKTLQEGPPLYNIVIFITLETVRA